MNDDVTVFPEPSLEFRYGQQAADPHDGLAMFGPYDTDMSFHPRNISCALVGAPSGCTDLRQWSRHVQASIPPDQGLDRRLWPVFPGFEAAFSSIWPTTPARTIELDPDSLDRASRERDPFKRASQVVAEYLSPISRIHEREEPVDVIVCVVPDQVHRNCRPRSHPADAVGQRLTPHARRRRQSGQMEMFDNYDPEIYQYSVDFRRQLKARSMQFGIPIQIIRESTLRIGPATEWGQRQLTPLSDRAWNLAVALYYKAGGKPWRLSTAREGVCYIGLAYRRQDPTSANRTACCAAQMFLDSGDGIVFMGKFGPWYSPADNQFHLTRAAARELLDGVLQTLVFPVVGTGFEPTKAFRETVLRFEAARPLVSVRVDHATDLPSKLVGGLERDTGGRAWTIEERWKRRRGLPSATGRVG